MICHFNLDTFELLEKLQFERERADGSTEPSADSMFKCNHLAGATDGGIRSSGRSNPDVSGISQNKKQGGTTKWLSKNSAQTPESLQGQNGSKRVPGF